MEKKPTVSGAARTISLPVLAPASPGTTAATSTKVIPRSRSRTYVSYACDACRKVKVKCDGVTPRCSACVRRNSECVYNLETDGRRTKDLKREHELLKSTTRDLVELFELLKSMPEQEAIEALHCIRTTSCPASALSSIRGDLLATRSSSIQKSVTGVVFPGLPRIAFELFSEHPVAYPLLEPLSVATIDLALLGIPWNQELGPPGKRQKCEEFLRRSPARPNHQLQAFYLPQRFSSFYSGLKAHDCVDSRLNKLEIRHWTDVAVTNEVASSALSLFLSNELAILNFFDAELFLEDLIAVRTRFCSKFLVNAILANACQTYAAIDSLASKLSFAFYNEAIKLWRLERTIDQLPTVAATMLLSIACNGFAIDATGLTFLHDGAAMAHRLRLFSPLDEQLNICSPNGILDLNMYRARATTAWGTFNWQTCHSFYFHQVSRTPTPPSLPIPGDWQSNSDPKDKVNQPISTLPKFMGRTFAAFCKFFRILHDMVWLYYKDEKAAGNPVTLADATVLYLRLLDWADWLPCDLVRSQFSPAHVMTLHIYFHTSVIDIFRPFNGSSDPVNLGTSIPPICRAKDICDASIKQLQRLTYQYRSSFDSANTGRLWHTGMLYVLNACIRDHLNPESTFYFLLCLRGYQKLMRCFRIAASIVSGILTIAMRNKVISPSDAKAIRQDFEAETGISFQPHEVASRYILDLELALTDPSAATMECLVKWFQELSVAPDHDAGPANSEAWMEVWRGNSELLLKS